MHFLFKNKKNMKPLYICVLHTKQCSSICDCKMRVVINYYYYEQKNELTIPGAELVVLLCSAAVPAFVLYWNVV